jgi:NADH-ubiquinone oxidoreductase chain 4L
MNLSLILFLIGILGFILNRKNIILMIIAIEIMLLSVTLLLLISSFGFDDNVGQTFSIFIISIAGAESVIGLSILVAFYRFYSSLISFYQSCYQNSYSIPCVYVPLNVNVRRRSKIIRSSITNQFKFYSTQQSKISLLNP